MPCAESDDRLQAYFDAELDAVAAAAFESHLASCGECRAALEGLHSMRAALRSALPYEHAPVALGRRIAAALDRESQEPAVRRRLRSGTVRPFWGGLLTGVGGGLLAAGLAVFLISSPRSLLPDELVNAHERSLLPSHLVDVESTDRHTVKPWFAGHVDVSPAVNDFTAQGYRLLGGRADYFEHQRAAALVYQHGAHLINVFSWAGDGPVAANTTRNGYRLAFWKAGNLRYAAVSDTGWDELLTLERLIRSADAAQDRG
jgi:anti-sigma factor RsiW